MIFLIENKRPVDLKFINLSQLSIDKYDNGYSHRTVCKVSRKEAEDKSCYMKIMSDEALNYLLVTIEREVMFYSPDSDYFLGRPLPTKEFQSQTQSHIFLPPTMIKEKSLWIQMNLDKFDMRDIINTDLSYHEIVHLEQLLYQN